MSKLIGLLFVGAIAVAGFLFYENAGKTKTVTAPNAPNAGDATRHAVANGDAWYQAHASQIGAVLAFLIVGGLCWLIWTKLPKAGLVLLILVILLALGFVKMSG